MNAVLLEQAIVVGDELAIRFENGFEMYLPLTQLRANCPCAECEQKRSAFSSTDLARSDRQNLHLLAVQVVGGYAIRLVWNDGHASGIYSFDLLKILNESTA